MSTIEAKRRSLGDLIGRYERRPIKLPQFQRSYSWEKSHVATFLSDLEAFITTFEKDPVVASYYLGSIVVIPSTTEITILDGQQRLATATIVLSAIRDVAKALDKGSNNEGSLLAHSIQKDLVERDTTPVTYSLTLRSLSIDLRH